MSTLLFLTANTKIHPMVLASQPPGCGMVYPEEDRPYYGSTSIWSTVFVTLVGLTSMFLFQVTVCWLLHRRRITEDESQYFMMRRLMTLLDHVEIVETMSFGKYVGVVLPDGEPAAAKKCPDEEQTPRPDRESRALSPPALTRRCSSQGGQPDTAMAVDVIDSGAEPSVTTDSETVDGTGSHRASQRGRILGCFTGLFCPLSPREFLSELGLWGPREGSSSISAGLVNSRMTRDEIMDMIRSMEERMPGHVVEELQVIQEQRSMRMWSQMQASVSVAERPNVHAESPLQEVVIGGFDVIHVPDSSPES